MKILGFNHGLIGDLVIGTITARAAKEQLGSPHITYNINKKCECIKPILENHEDIDNFYISNTYEPWPDQKDKNAFSDFDKVYDAMAKHTSESWYHFKHQTVENCHMHGLKAPSSLQIKLNKYFSYKKHRNIIALCPFGATRGGEKNLSLTKAAKIANIAKDMGYNPVQIYLKGQEKIPNVSIFEGTLFEAVKFCLGCKLVITVDTAMSWIMSGYQHPVLGLYTPSYYGTHSARNWMPINPNALYLEDHRGVNHVEDFLIKQGLQKI